MGRHVSKFTMGPPGVCDACGRFCQGLHQAGKRCYHCGKGIFIHRGEWDFRKCPACNDENDGWGCDNCHGTGIVATWRARIE
jgi:hypothetical protein